MKRKTTLITSMILILSLLSFVVYRDKVPAKSPAQMEVAAGQTQAFGLVSVAMAGEAVKTSVCDINEKGQTLFDFSGETVGSSPKTFTPAVGNWIIGSDENNTVLVVDGRKWKRGIASAGLADKARALYGERYAEFLDNVTAYAYYPFAVAGNVENFTNGEIIVRFKGVGGRIDQGAGILFDLKPNGCLLRLFWILQVESCWLMPA